MIHRYWCEPCDIVATVIRDVRACEIRCPRCGGIALPASGDER